MATGKTTENNEAQTAPGDKDIYEHLHSPEHAAEVAAAEKKADQERKNEAVEAGPDDDSAGSRKRSARTRDE